MAAERKRVLWTVFQISLDRSFVHITNKCELGDLEMMTKHGLTSSVEKTQLMISPWLLEKVGIMQEDTNVALWELISFELRNNDLIWIVGERLLISRTGYCQAARHFRAKPKPYLNSRTKINPRLYCVDNRLIKRFWGSEKDFSKSETEAISD
jgi:hypothetical protein